MVMRNYCEFSYDYSNGMYTFTWEPDLESVADECNFIKELADRIFSWLTDHEIIFEKDIFDFKSIPNNNVRFLCSYRNRIIIVSIESKELATLFKLTFG